MNYGLIALIFLQLALSGGTFFVLARMLAMKSELQREMARASENAGRAVHLAEDAERHVEALELSHYRALQARQLAVETEIGRWQSKVDGLIESQAHLSVKLTSREKTDRKVEKAAAPATESQVTIDDLIAQGLAQPLGVVPEAPARKANFGRRV